MRRRALLRGLAGLATGASAATAGCFDRSGVVGTSVEHVDPRRLRGSRSTVVAFDDEAGVVRVTGFMYYGSSSCNRVGITDATYDAGDASVRVVLDAVDDQWLPMGCTADMSGTWYRATVRFAGELPERVTVAERGGGEASTTRTVDRTEQRSLCTTDHPEGSRGARRAHWTCPERYLAAANSTGATTPDGDAEDA